MSSQNRKVNVTRFDPPSLRMSPVDAMERLLEDNKHLRSEVLRLEQGQQRLMHELNLRQSDFTPGVIGNTNEVPGGPLPGYGYRGSYAGQASPYGVPSIPIPRLHQEKMKPLPYRKSLSPGQSRAASPVSRGQSRSSKSISRQGSTSWRGRRMQMMEKSTGRSASPSVYLGEKKPSRYDVDLTNVLDRRWPCFKDIGDPMTPAQRLARPRRSSPRQRREVVHSQQLMSNYNNRQKLLEQPPLTQQLRQSRHHAPSSRSEPSFISASASSQAPPAMGYLQGGDLMRQDSKASDGPLGNYHRQDSKNSVVSFQEVPEIRVTSPGRQPNVADFQTRASFEGSRLQEVAKRSARKDPGVTTLDHAGQQRVDAILTNAAAAPVRKQENRYDALLNRLNRLENKFTNPKKGNHSSASGSKTPTPPMQYMSSSRSRTPTPPPIGSNRGYAGPEDDHFNESSASAEGIAMASNWQKLNVRPAQAMLEQSATNTNHVMMPRVNNEQSVTRTNHVGALDASVTNPNHRSISTTVVPNQFRNLEATNTNHVGTSRGIASEATTVAALNPRNAGVHPAQGVVGGGFSTFGTTNADAFTAATNHQPMGLSEQGAQAFLNAREREQPNSLQETLQAQSNLQSQEDARFVFNDNRRQPTMHQQASILEESALMQSASTAIDGGQDNSGGGHTAFFGSSAGHAQPPLSQAPILGGSGGQNFSGSGARLASVHEDHRQSNSSINSSLGNDILARLNKISALGQSSVPQVGHPNNASSAALNASSSFSANAPQAFSPNVLPHQNSQSTSGNPVNKSDSSGKAAGNQRAGRGGLEAQAHDMWAQVMGDSAQLF